MSRPRVDRRGRGLLAVAVAIAVGLAACRPGATFSAEGACLADGRVAGAYPALEALVPTSLEGRAPDSIDSGRSCTDAALGSLVARGVHELRFAGATWRDGPGAGTSVAVLENPAGELPVALAEEFYEIGARAAKKTDNVTTRRPSYPGISAAFRLDALNDSTYETIVLWQGGSVVRVVIVASAVNPNASMAAHDARVSAAVAAAVAAAAV